MGLLPNQFTQSVWAQFLSNRSVIRRLQYNLSTCRYIEFDKLELSFNLMGFLSNSWSPMVFHSVWRLKFINFRLCQLPCGLLLPPAVGLWPLAVCSWILNYLLYSNFESKGSPLNLKTHIEYNTCVIQVLPQSFYMFF